MEIVRTFEAGGELWGVTPEGVTFKWDRGAAQWRREESIAAVNRKLTAAAVQTIAPAEAASQSRGTSVQILEDGEQVPDPFSDHTFPMTPLDKIWNEKFPPFSGRRLIFGIVMLPIIGLVNQAWRSFKHGSDFSWPTYVFTVIAGCLILTAVFALQWAKEGATPRANRRSPGRLDEFVLGPDRILDRPGPDRSQKEESAEPPLWQNLSTLTAGSLPNPGREIGISTLLFSVGILGSIALIDSSTVSPLSILVIVALSGVISTMLHYRAWLLLAVLFSGMVGFVPAIFFTLFNAFMGGPKSLVVNWLIASFFVFTFVAPFAWNMKRKVKTMDRTMRFPTWMMAALVCVLMLLSTGFFAMFEASPSEPESTAQEGPPHLRSTLMSPRIASQQLYLAWQKNSRSDAEQIASPEVVMRLFSIPYANQVYRGCGFMRGTNSDYWCVIENGQSLLLMKGVHTDGGFYIGELKSAPLNTPIVGATVAEDRPKLPGAP